MKSFEYLAGNHPIISTPLDEICVSGRQPTLQLDDQIPAENSWDARLHKTKCKHQLGSRIRARQEEQ
jgi:hypothetical protein